MFWLPSPLPVHTAPPLLTHPCSIRALARHFPPRIQRVRRAQLRLRHPEDAAGTSARRDRSEHFRRCCGSRSFTSIGPKRTSHVTRHTSHVTRHTSHVTRHTSHITRHTHRLVQSASDTTSLAHKTSPVVCVCWVLIWLMRSCSPAARWSSTRRRTWGGT